MLCDIFRTLTPQPDKTSRAPNGVKSSYEEHIVGVWRVLIMKDKSLLSFLNFQWENLHTSLEFLLRVLRDVYTISPRSFVISLMVNFWFAIEGPLSLYFSNRLLFFIEERVSGDFPNGRAPLGLYWAAISRVACLVLDAYVRMLARINRNAHASRIKYEFQARFFSADLACDLQTAQEQTTFMFDIENVHDCLEQGIAVVNDMISFLLHIRFVLHVIGSGLNDGGPVFVALCLLPPLLSQFTLRELWTKAYVVSPENKFFIRKSALEQLSDVGLKEEVISGGINKYLTDEYRKAKDGLGDTPDTHPEFLLGQASDALPRFVMSVCSDVPTLYFALLAIIGPSKLSIVQLAVLNQTSTSLRYTFSSIGSSLATWPSKFSRLKNVYAALDIRSKMKDGETPFPRPGYEASGGMSIQVRDVSFSYPNVKSERAALTGVSFTISPGQLVVIVGANGSGKSTIIKLLDRIYEPDTGSILIDGIPIEEYRMEELRKGIALLTQEHRLFQLSVRENIQLGSYDADAMKDEGKINASVLAAGAEAIVKNFSKEYDAVLESFSTGYVSYAGRGIKELETVHKELENSTSVSGGEKQKLVAARTFMRLFTSPVKLVAVDEPSSALDPEAEYRLFTNLRQERNGRTMIFVTHRFGHLTKHADLIICVKEGAVVETGTHADLLSKGGEYAHLYNVQAQAFSTA